MQSSTGTHDSRSGVIKSGLLKTKLLPTVCMHEPAERANFPTDLYMLEGLIRQLGSKHELRLVDHYHDISASLSYDVAVVVLTHVSYRTARMLDMAKHTELAHRAYDSQQTHVRGCGLKCVTVQWLQLAVTAQPDKQS